MGFGVLLPWKRRKILINREAVFGKRLTLFRLLGFEVRMDASWLILAWFVTWSLARGYFPTQYPNMPPSTYWWMGAAGALGLFLSLVFHELCHSLVATRYGIPMKGITLFIFGGVAEMDDEPPSAKAEFFMAGAGPLSSFFIGMVLYGLSKAGISSGLSVCVIAVIYYLAWLNLALAVFNLIPAFPLDGGRVLRATLWNWKKNFRWATNIAAQIGSGFGIVLIVLGIISFFRQNFIGGLWWFMIGIFVKNAAQMSYRQALTRKALEGEKVSRFMIANPITVPPSTSMEEFVNEYVYKYHFKMFPVVSWGKLLGCVGQGGSRSGL
jgi:Zn-dependent protease